MSSLINILPPPSLGVNGDRERAHKGFALRAQPEGPVRAKKGRGRDKG